MNKLVLGKFDNPKDELIRMSYKMLEQGYTCSQIWESDDYDDGVIGGINLDDGERHTLIFSYDKYDCVTLESDNTNIIIKIYNKLLNIN